MNAATLSITTDRRDRHHAVLRISGEIDLVTVESLRDELMALLAEGRHYLVADLSKVGFCDSTGLGVLVEVLRQALTRGGWFRLVGLQPIVEKAFSITGLSEIFSIFDTVERAIAAPHPKAAGPD